MVADYTALLKKLIPDPGGEDAVRLRAGVVTAVNNDGTVNVRVSGTIIQCSRLASASVSNGDAVAVLTSLGEALVLGTYA